MKDMNRAADQQKNEQSVQAGGVVHNRQQRVGGQVGK